MTTEQLALVEVSPKLEIVARDDVIAFEIEPEDIARILIVVPALAFEDEKSLKARAYKAWMQVRNDKSKSRETKPSNSAKGNPEKMERKATP